MANLKIKAFGASDKGYVREVNEDSYIIEEGKKNVHFQGLKLLMAVADGMGGLSKGDIISSIVTKGLEKVFIPPEDLKIDSNEEFIKNFIVLRVKEINKYIYESFNRAATNGGATLDVLVIYENRYIVCHAGDSRVYLIRDKKIKQLTEDDSFVMQEVRKGRITLEQAKNHPKKNIITKAIGIQRDINPVIICGDIQEGDSFIVTSDGILNVVEDTELKDFVLKYSPEKACNKLIELANKREVDDNVTLNIAKIGRRVLW